MTIVELANYKNGKFARFQINSKNKKKQMKNQEEESNRSVIAMNVKCKLN